MITEPRPFPAATPERSDGLSPRLLKARRNKRALGAVGIGFLLVFVGVQAVIGLRIRSREQRLQRHGVDTTGVVVATDSDGESDYLMVRLEDCGCTVGVATTDPDGHPPGSTLPVRHDPARPGRAVALVDRPNPYDRLVAVGVGLTITAALIPVLLLTQRRRRQKALRLLEATTPTMEARVEAWQRVVHNTTLYYLSVYPARSGSGRNRSCASRSRPIHCATCRTAMSSRCSVTCNPAVPSLCAGATS